MEAGVQAERDDAGEGLTGVVPFHFTCQRSGRCCSAGEGYIWVEEDEVAPMAAHLGMEVDLFRRIYLRSVTDPACGALRLSLTEEAGRCSLLEGTRECRVYAARPGHCARFPFWSSVLSDPAAFERARAVCPGIAVVVEGERRRQAFERLAQLYRELDEELALLAPRCELSGRCCRFEEFGHELFATGLEADYALEQARRGGAELPVPEGAGRCPFHQGGRCTEREGRALGCRTFFCDAEAREALEELHERYLARLRQIDYPPAYARFPDLLAARMKSVGFRPADSESKDRGKGTGSGTSGEFP